jgi:hypothetical protein
MKNALHSYYNAGAVVVKRSRRTGVGSGVLLAAIGFHRDFHGKSVPAEKGAKIFHPCSICIGVSLSIYFTQKYKK